MQRFSELQEQLETLHTGPAQSEALADYLAQTPEADKAWAVYLLAGGRPRQVVSAAVLRAAACEAAQLPPWLFEAAYQATGDLAETIAHVIPPGHNTEPLGLAPWLETRLLPLRGQSASAKTALLIQWWRELDTPQRFVLNKLVNGHWHAPVSPERVLQALAQQASISPQLLAQRLGSDLNPGFMPTPAWLATLLAPAQADGPVGTLPYPFLKPQALPADQAADAEQLTPLAQWQIEWQYEGLRAQLIKQGDSLQLWSAEGALLTAHFPTVQAQARSLPGDFALDGVILVWNDNTAGPSGAGTVSPSLARGASRPGKSATADMRFLAFDLLAQHGTDLRPQPLHLRRIALETLQARAPALHVTPLLVACDAAGLHRLQQTSRRQGTAGLLLKRRESHYSDTDKPWLQWPASPLTAKAVLVYGHVDTGQRNGVCLAYTLAVWNRSPRSPSEAQSALAAIARRETPAKDALQLVPVAKVTRPLSEQVQRNIDSHFQAHTIDRFGPVRSVQPALVFELACEAAAPSKRHKSGLVLRLPRLLHRLSDMDVGQIDTLAHLQTWLDTHRQE
jgi:DNA ligase 1